MLMPAYEGPEKKLEIILSAPLPGLRSDTDGRWRKTVALSRAEIISKISADFLDAYLLSESSLFVWENRIVIITCGKTAPVRALPLLLDIVGKDRIAFLFYEQRNFMLAGSHAPDFEKDCAQLRRFFPGKSQQLGTSGHDCVNLFHFFHNRKKLQRKPVFQILMHDLDAENMQMFCQNANVPLSEIPDISGLNALCDPKMLLDAHLFSPCGYSLNGIKEKEYLAIHITPQPGNSYASFETGIRESRWEQIIGKVLAVFKPARFSLMLTSGMEAEKFACAKAMEYPLRGYSPVHKNLYEPGCGYSVLFINYIKTGTDK